MLYIIIRMLFVIALTIAGYALLKIFNNRTFFDSKKKRILIFSLIAVFFLVLVSIPFENLFIRFDSAEKAYKYQETGNILLSIEDKEHAVIIANDRGGKTYTVYKRDHGGWLLNYPVPGQYSDVIFHDRFSVIKCCTEKNSCFLIVYPSLAKNEELLTVSDNMQSEFSVLLSEDNIKYIYCHVKNIDNDYTLYINGEPVYTKS